jgi:tRNA threonylcarbamoyladenosine biosynthesis protein TsaE
MKTIITNSFEQTQKLGLELASTLKGGEVIALHGDLGSGKTTFVQGLAEGLGIKQRIISPTFIIMRTYVIPDSDPGSTSLDSGLRRNDRNGKNFFHVDLYRIETERDVEGLGLLELIGDSENIVVIEWPEKIGHLLPETRIDISFEYIGDDKRRIVIPTEVEGSS